MRRLMLLAVSLVAAPLAAQAPGHWLPIPRTHDVAYYDDHIRAQADGTRVLRILIPQFDGYTLGSARFDCHGRWRVVSDSEYNGQDSLTAVFHPDTAWSTVRGDANSAILQQVACGQIS